MGLGKPLRTKSLPSFIAWCPVWRVLEASVSSSCPCLFPLPWPFFAHLQNGEENPFSASCEVVHVKAPGKLQTVQITVMIAMIMLHVKGYKEHRLLLTSQHLSRVTIIFLTMRQSWEGR